MNRIKTSKITSEAENPRLPDIGEDALIREAQAGDKDAFVVIWNHYRPIVAGLMWRLLGNNNDFQDLIQEIYIKAWQGIDGFRGESKFSSWLFRIASNCCLTHLKRSNNGAARCGSIEELTERQKQTEKFKAPESAEDSLTKRVKLEMTQLLYKKLKVRDQRIFDMVVEKHKNVDEVVAELDEKRQHVLYVLGHFVEKLNEALSAHSSRKRPVVSAKANKISGPKKMGTVGF